MAASIANQSSQTRIRLLVVVDSIAERHSLALQHAIGEERFDELAGERAGGLTAGAGMLEHNRERDTGTLGRSIACEPGMIGLSAAGLGRAALSRNRDLRRADGVVASAGGIGHGL